MEFPKHSAMVMAFCPERFRSADSAIVVISDVHAQKMRGRMSLIEGTPGRGEDRELGHRHHGTGPQSFKLARLYSGPGANLRGDHLARNGIVRRYISPLANCHVKKKIIKSVACAAIITLLDAETPSVACEF